jgi:hypothetical protein
LQYENTSPKRKRGIDECYLNHFALACASGYCRLDI